jgi:hypothetical protein
VSRLLLLLLLLATLPAVLLQFGWYIDDDNNNNEADDCGTLGTFPAGRPAFDEQKLEEPSSAMPHA